MSHLKRLIVEIHRRSLWQVLTIYAVSSWITLQVADTATAALGLPDWVPSVAFVMLIVLLPVVLATAFVQEGVDGGAGRPEPTPGAETTRPETPAELLTAEPQGVHHRVLTWRNAIAAAVVMLALLTVSAGGYMGLRAAGVGPFGTLMSKGVLEERDRIVLADFENHTSDSLLAMGATQFFRTAMSQSTAVHLANQDYVASVLERMEKEPDTRLDYELAREVAVRQGLKAVVAGEVIAVGGSYAVSARFVAAETGEVLWTDTETAHESSQVIEAVDRLSRRLRERVGESLKTVRASEPLPDITTTSLEALQQYALGIRLHYKSDYERAAAFYEEAIALDSTFAMAYRALAMCVRGKAQREALTRAYQFRHRASPIERYWIEGDYHRVVTEDLDASIKAYEMCLEVSDSTEPGNLAVAYRNVRDYERAERINLIDLAVTDSAPINLSTRAQVLVALGRFDEARVALERAIERGGEVDLAIVFLEAARQNFDEAEAKLHALREEHGRDPGWRVDTSLWLAVLARLRGRLAEAERHRDDVIFVQEQQGRTALAISNSAVQGVIDVRFKGDTTAALERVEAALVRWPLDSIPLADRPYFWLVYFYVWTGQAKEARAYLAEFEAQPENKNRTFRMQQHYLLGDLALIEGRPGDAVNEYRRADELDGCPMCALGSLALAYDQAGEPDSALAVYERYVTTPWIWRNWADSWWLAFAYERLGDLYEQRGDASKAIYYYGKFVDLWKDADPELQPRVEAARRVKEGLSPDT